MSEPSLVDWVTVYGHSWLCPGNVRFACMHGWMVYRTIAQHCFLVGLL